jgi:outer membrane protein OmpA-like peptidoglycan-associated protein
VVGYLRDKSVAGARLIARGVGESAPLVPRPPAGRDLNRRLQVIITPLSS